MEKIAFDPRGSQKIRKFLTGGAAGGASVGLAIALANYLKDLHGEAVEDTSADDDILYLDMPAKPQVPGAPTKSATVSGGVALTGGLLAALGSAAAVRQVTQALKKRELQKQLDKAQNAYTDTVQDEASELDKKAAQGGVAGVPMHKGDWATSLPLSLLLLTTLSSGALTYKGLDKYFPAAKKPKSNQPKRVVIRNKKSQPSYYEEEDSTDEETFKEASYDDVVSDTDIEDDAMELLVKLALHNPARGSDLRDLVSAVAQGRFDEVCSLSHNFDMDHALDTVKNASEVDVDSENINLAVSLCVKSAYLRPTVAMLAFAEFNDMAPSSVKAASQMTEGAQDALIKIAGVLGATLRNEYWASKFDKKFTTNKEASMLSPQLIEQLLASGLEGGLGDPSEESFETPLTTETESEVSVSQRPEDALEEENHGRARVAQSQSDSADEIDVLMSGMAQSD